jgi:excisionase family DNA binding protein
MSTRTAPTRLLSRAEAAEYLGLSVQTLAKWAMEGQHLKFIKVGKFAKYRQADLDRWIESRTVASTGDLGHPDQDVAKAARDPNAHGKRIKK